jgi:hypothetical protein
MSKLDQVLNRLTDHAFTQVGFETDQIHTGAGVSIMLRVSRCPWPTVIDGQDRWVRTIDIVRIYSDYSRDSANWTDIELDVAKMPRGLGAPIYAAMEKICRKHGYALKIECVINERLRQSLIEKHGFKLQGHSASFVYNLGFENSVIKVFDPICIVK